MTENPSGKAVQGGACLDGGIPGAVNLRDLGGYASRLGRGLRVRQGRVFRSGITHQIEAEGLNRLARHYGIRRILDLRSDRECERDGLLSADSHGIEVHRYPVYGTTAVTPGGERERYALMVRREYDWADRYRVLASEFPQSFVELIASLAREGGTPAIFHCSAGRDRTGVTAALLLEVLGVTREDIATDYAMTGERLAPHVWRYAHIRDSMGFSDAEIVELFRTEPEDMLRFLSWLSEAHDGAEAYLLRHGMQADDIRSLRERMLVDTEG